MTAPNLDFLPLYQPSGTGLIAPGMGQQLHESTSLRACHSPHGFASVRKSIPINDRHPRGGVVRPIPRAGILWACHDSSPLSALSAVSTIVRLPVDQPLRLRDTVREIKLGCRILDC